MVIIFAAFNSSSCLNWHKAETWSSFLFLSQLCWCSRLVAFQSGRNSRRWSWFDSGHCTGCRRIFWICPVFFSALLGWLCLLSQSSFPRVPSWVCRRFYIFFMWRGYTSPECRCFITSLTSTASASIPCPPQPLSSTVSSWVLLWEVADSGRGFYETDGPIPPARTTDRPN